MLNDILAISGKPGLFKLVSQGKNMIIVESLLDKRRMPAYGNEKITSLGDIAMYTDEEDVPLREVFKSIQTKENGAKIEMDVKKDSFKAWFLAARPKTLTGAAVPVMIGLSLAWKDAQLYVGDVFNWVAATLCLLFAFIMQIDANFINDFVDYAKGTDDRETRLGPERACTQG